MFNWGAFGIIAANQDIHEEMEKELQNLFAYIQKSPIQVDSFSFFDGRKKLYSLLLCIIIEK